MDFKLNLRDEECKGVNKNSAREKHKSETALEFIGELRQTKVLTKWRKKLSRSISSFIFFKITIVNTFERYTTKCYTLLYRVKPAACVGM